VKIIILAVRDTGGTAWNLAHAINKITPEHQAINIRGINSYLDYPAMVDVGYYNKSKIRQIIYKADVLVFLGSMKPFYQSLKLSKGKLRNKKKLLYETGSLWRWAKDALIKEADEILEDYTTMLGTSDLFLPNPKDEKPISDKIEFLPWTRSFSEINSKFGMCNQDRKALDSFDVKKRNVIFLHAPTNEEAKGSQTFFRTATRAMQMISTMTFNTVRQEPWVACLRALSQADVLLDQNPPFPTSYGAISVEGAIFHLPVINQISPKAQQWIKEKTGLDTPFITFKDEDDLVNKMVSLATQPELRIMFGDMNYKYCKALHDEKPVVERFFKILDGIS